MYPWKVDLHVSMTVHEEHIRELCELALTAKSDKERPALLSELRSAVRDHMDDVRARAAEAMSKTFRAA